MNSDIAVEFAHHLRIKKFLAGDPGTGPDGSERTLRKLWELTELSASDFAEEVARFYGFARVNLPDLLAASSLVPQFSRRFLREMTVFPCRSAEGSNVLAIADPSDVAAIGAAQIVLGNDVEVRIASFEDIAAILDQRLGEEDSAAQETYAAAVSRDDDIESLRDLASGAPVVRAVNDLLEKAVELRASDIHIEPFRTGLVIRMRVDGLLRAMPAPVGTLPQAVISRIKILAGLNIAERRLPQDGAARLRVARSDLDIRVAIMPTQQGESAVIRLLPNDRGMLAIDRLGLSTGDDTALRRLPAQPHGV